MPSQPAQIPVEVNSLYITTVPLVTGPFHWALIHVDASGVITKHQWVAVTRDIEGLEEYHAFTVEDCRAVTRGTQILAYFKIDNVMPPSRNQMSRICQSVFPHFYTTVADNRAHGITCRTFVIRALRNLLSDNRVQEIEDAVKAESTNLSNEYASSFLWGRPYECRTFTI